MKLTNVFKSFAVCSLAIATAFTMTACGGEEAPASTTSSSTPASSSEVASTPAADDTDADTAPTYIEVPVTIVNGTGVDIAELYVSGETSEDWGDDQLGDQVMEHGNYLDLVLYVDSANLLWDIMITDLEGTSIEFYGMDITEMPADGFVIELLFDGTDATALAMEDISTLQGDYNFEEGGADDTTATDDGEVYDVSDEVAGTVWVDDALTVYGFGEDAQTLYVTLEDGTELEGTYQMLTDAEDVVVLSMYVPSLEFEVHAVVTGVTEEALEFTDLATEETTIMVPVA